MEKNMNTWFNLHDHDNGEFFSPISVRLRRTEVCVKDWTHPFLAGLGQRVGQVHGVRMDESKVRLQYYTFLVNLTTCSVGSTRICTHDESFRKDSQDSTPLNCASTERAKASATSLTEV